MSRAESLFMSGIVRFGVLMSTEMGEQRFGKFIRDGAGARREGGMVKSRSPANPQA